MESVLLFPRTPIRRVCQTAKPLRWTLLVVCRLADSALQGDARITNHGPRVTKKLYGQTNQFRRNTIASMMLLPSLPQFMSTGCVLGNSHTTHRAVGFSPRGLANGQDVTHPESPRGLKPTARGRRERRCSAYEGMRTRMWSTQAGCLESRKLLNRFCEREVAAVCSPVVGRHSGTIADAQMGYTTQESAGT